MTHPGYSFASPWDALTYRAAPAPTIVQLSDITEDRVNAALDKHGPSMPFVLAKHMGESSQRVGQKMGKMFDRQMLSRVPARAFRTFTYSRRTTQ